jgi:hypothetical protein
MAFLILLTNALIPELHLPYGFPILAGAYEDFDPWWYQNVGLTIIFTMIINIAIPYCIQGIFIVIKKYKAFKDRGFSSDMSMT